MHSLKEIKEMIQNLLDQGYLPITRKEEAAQPELDLPEGFTQEMGAQLFTWLRGP